MPAMGPNFVSFVDSCNAGLINDVELFPNTQTASFSSGIEGPASVNNLPFNSISRSP